MISARLMQLLLIEYVLITGVCLWERDWPRTLYWAGAVVLQIGVMWGMK